MTTRTLILCLLLLAGLQAHGESGFETGTIAREDGVGVHWHLDRRGHDGSQGILVLAQGSGCASPIHNTAIEKAARIAPDSAVVLLEKAGVATGFRPSGEECPASFHDQHTLSGWASDLQQVIAELRKSDWWNGELVLFGGSEGGAMITLAADRIPETDALVVLSSGLGMTMADTLLAVVPPEVAANLEHQFVDIRAQPESSTVWSGHAFRWWHEVLDRNFIADLLALEIPVMLIQGGRDRSVPVQSGRSVQQAFEEAGQSNLSYREYPEFDHGMVDADGNTQLDRVIAEAADWLEQVLDTRGDHARLRGPAISAVDPSTLQDWFDQRDYAAVAAWLDSQETLSTEARYWTARLALLDGQGELALELAEGLVADNAAEARLHVLLAEALAASLDGAGTFRQMRVARQIRTAYETAIEVQPDHVDAHFGLFVYALQAPAVVGGGSGRAREQAGRLEAIDPAWGAFARARLAADEGEPEAERRALAMALDHDPNHQMARFRAGLQALVDEDWESARTHFTVLVEAAPFHMAAWYQLGRVAAESGQELNIGRKAFNRYLEADHRRGNPSKAAAHWRLGMIEQHAGQTEIARDHYRQALNLDSEFENAREALAALNQQENGS